VLVSLAPQKFELLPVHAFAVDLLHVFDVEQAFVVAPSQVLLVVLEQVLLDALHVLFAAPEQRFVDELVEQVLPSELTQLLSVPEPAQAFEDEPEQVFPYQSPDALQTLYPWLQLFPLAEVQTS
jgi:hypothetical protein